MAETQFHQPDGAAMERLLKEYQYEPTGVILHLAWREGLTRTEIGELTWEQVDFDTALLRLPDREVPLEPDTAELLAKWRFRCARFSPYVAVTDRLRNRLAPQSMSRMARLALDSAGQTDVRLQDLRHDYIRRQFAAHDWPYVLRISGVSVSTYRNEIAPLLGNPAPAETGPRDEVGDEYRLWQVLQAERRTPAGLALWLSSRLGLQSEEIVRLSWEQVDFDANVVRLPDREITLPVAVRRVLEEELARRAPGDDPHVLLTPRSRKPMDAARLTTVVRDALIRGGIENRTLLDFRRDAAREAERARLRAWVAERGSVSRGEAAELLDLSDGQAYRRLLALAEEGELVRVNSRYYPAAEAVRPEQQRETILRYIAEAGPARRLDIANLLHIGERSTARILKRMVNAGDLSLLRPSLRYALAERPAEAAETAEQAV